MEIEKDKYYFEKKGIENVFIYKQVKYILIIQYFYELLFEQLKNSLK